MGKNTPETTAGKLEASQIISSSDIRPVEQSIVLSQLTQAEAAGVQESWHKGGKRSPCSHAEKRSFETF